MRSDRGKISLGLSTICLLYRGCPREAIASLDLIGNTINFQDRVETTIGDTCLAVSLCPITLAIIPNFIGWSPVKVRHTGIQHIRPRATSMTKWKMTTWADLSVCIAQRIAGENSTTTLVREARTIKADILLSPICWTCTTMGPHRSSRRTTPGHSRTSWRTWCLNSLTWSKKNRWMSIHRRNSRLEATTSTNSIASAT